MAMKISRRNLFAAGGSTAMIAMVGSASSSLAQSAASQTSQDLSATPDTLGAKARQAMIDIFRKKDATAVDRYFGESFIQHDPTLAYGASAIAFDLFRFEDGKIIEHWGGQEPEAPPNLSGRTQVDGPTEVLDREKTEVNRTLVWTYRETVMVSLRFDRIEEFIEGDHYAQHASKIGDGIARLRDRIANVAKEGGRLYLTARRFVAEGNFVLVLTEGDLPSGPTALYGSVSDRERKNS
jgi:predicted SnoaL-like aldol condensation-catalyzing enzyme